MSRILLASALGVVLSPLALTTCPAAEPNDQRPYTPKVLGPSDDGQRAIAGFRVPQGFKVELFAAEPLLANPVAFCVDEHNRFYVAETFRLHAGVTDTRGHMNWLDDDLACRTVDDRVAMYRRYLGKQFASYGTEHDRVRLVEDRNGDGTADHATVFADGFHDYAVGIGAGVLARKGDVYYTCIPDLWRLRDTNGDGQADVRQLLHHGYGVHVGFLGHDLHGLRFGPDGRLYFSIGDRGFNVEADGKRLTVPDTGSVLRCEPDGSHLEVVATGLRNPQELAFDEYGNLFTADNNSDGGDRARFVYVVEGGDSGWRMGYQYIQSPSSRGPWNAEKLWNPHFDDQAAYLVPPLANLADGPSGLTHDPGTGLPEPYRGHFFLADFRGSSGQSGIRSFAVKPQGAGFEVVDQTQFLWSVLATDVDFGTDSALYFTDWVEGWNQTGKGRIYRVTNPALADPAARQVKTLLSEDLSLRSIDGLTTLLAHPDMRVRQEAQFALAGKGLEALAAFTRVANDRGSRLARLHAIWGLGQLGRKHPRAYEPVLKLLADDDAEIRAQAARLAGDGGLSAASTTLMGLLADSSPRVRFFAALSLGKLKARAATPALLALLRENADADPFLRHAGVMGLAGAGDVDALLKAASDPAAAVRMGVLLALRRLERPEVARFLDDAEPRLVLEAARAINDAPIPAAFPQLAALAGGSGQDVALWRRVINANFRLGGADAAAALAKIAKRTDVPAAIRTEAVQALGDWHQPPGRDRVMGLWRPLPERPAAEAAAALRPALAALLSDESGTIGQAAALAAGKLRIREAAPALVKFVADQDRSTDARIEALKALDAMGDDHLAEAVRTASADSSPRLRTEGLRILARVQPAEAVAALNKALEGDSVVEQQGAFSILGTVNGPAADALLARWLDRLLAGQVPAEIQLDLIEAAAQHSAPEVKQKLAQYESRRPADDPLAPYREALAGGNSRRGSRLFFQKEEISCLRCHKVRGRGGEVGPELTGIGSKQKREYLLEALVAPNRQIAQGFETLIIATTDGQVHSGVLKSQDEKTITLIDADGRTTTLRKDTIDEQKRGASAMPDDLVKALTRQELRDLVEFLAGLK